LSVARNETRSFLACHAGGGSLPLLKDSAQEVFLTLTFEAGEPDNLTPKKFDRGPVAADERAADAYDRVLRALNAIDLMMRGGNDLPKIR
jgi:hypothetical protein